MKNKIVLTEKQIDALKEVGSIGSGHAAIALSQMLGRRINMAITKVEVVPSTNFIEFIGEKNINMVSTYVKILGDMEGGIALLFKREDALKLSDLLMNRESGTSKFISEMDQSAIKESGNVISGSYLSALSLMVDCKMALSIPRFTFDNIKTLLKGILQEVLPGEEKAVSLITEFIESSSQIKGYYLFLPNPTTLKNILGTLAK